MPDLVIIIGLSVGACLLTGLLGAVVLHLIRRFSLRYQLVTAALLPVVAVALAVVANVVEMFLSGHDSGVVLIALAVALGLAVLGAWLVTRPLLLGFRRLSLAIAALTEPLTLSPSGTAGEGGASTAGSSSAPRHSGSAASSPAERSERLVVPAELAAALADVAVARQSLHEARTRERVAEEARRELVSFMSHDLRTPLAGLRAVVEGIEDGIVADVPRALGHLRATVARMSLLVDDLFALSRVQGPGAPEQRRAVSLAEVVDDIVLETSTIATAAGVHLEAEIDAEDRLTVLGNYADLTRAVTNLVTNAIRHTAPGLSVVVAAGRTTDGAVRVEVVDQCGGIPEPHLARVFDTGWRGNQARNSNDGGAGLGLAIVRGVIQSHDGNIGVRNTSNGCSFAVELPPPAPSELGTSDQAVR